MLQKYNTKPKYWEDAKRFLMKKDPVLSQIMQRVGNKDFLTRNSTSFQTLSNAIIGQQISVAAAASISQKLRNKIGSISPLKINKMSKVTMRNTGLSRQKIEYLKLLASCFINKPHFFYKLHEQSDDDVIMRLCELKGIGEWTAQMYLIFQLNRPNILPMADIGFLNGVIKVYKLKKNNTSKIIEIANNWGTYKTVAVWFIWRVLDPDVVQY